MSSYSTVLRATAAAEMSRVQNPTPAEKKEDDTTQLTARLIIIKLHIDQHG